MVVDLFSPFDPIDGTPVTIVFGTFDYRNVINKWIDHALSNCDHWRIICLDKELISWLNEMGHDTRAVYLYDLFPDVTPHSLNNLNEKSKAQIIFELRKKLFYALAKSGRDFIHSDADAFWLQDPRPWLAQHNEFDLLISQGTHGPKSHFIRYHFTLCAGFFLCRANTRTQDYFRQVAEAEWFLDQKSMNEILLQDPEARWEIHQPSIWWSSAGRVGGKWRKIPILPGVLAWGQRFTPLLLRRIEAKLLQLRCPGKLCRLRSLLNYIYISPQIIDGKFSNGLTVGVIPMHLVTRIRHRWQTSPFVVHTNDNKKYQAVEK